MPLARRAVAECAEELGGDSVAEAIALAVTEACANVVVHAYRDDTAAGEMTVSLESSNDCLRAYVADDGVGMLPRLDSPGLGLGIPLISQLTDGFELRARPEGGTEICMQFTLGTKVAADGRGMRATSKVGCRGVSGHGGPAKPSPSSSPPKTASPSAP